MKKIAICLTVVLLLFAGCTLQQSTGVEVPGTLPTLSGREMGTLDGEGRTPLSTDSGIVPDAQHTLPQANRETEPSDAQLLKVYIAEIEGKSRSKPSADKASAVTLPTEGAMSFGASVPLTLSAVLEADGTAVVTFPDGNVYVYSGRLPTKQDGISLKFGEMVYVAVRENGSEANYAIWLGTTE